MITRLQITILLAFAAAVLGVILHFEGVALRVVWFGYVPKVSIALVVLVMSFEWVVWKLLPERVVGRPKIEGTWRGVLRSSWTDPATGKVGEPIPCFVAITQTFSTIGVRQYTAKSTSKSVTARILRDDDVFILECTYLNEAPPESREKNPMHYGTMRLVVTRGDVVALRGPYWTDRGTFGQIELAERQRKIVDGYESATQLFAAAVSASAPGVGK